MAEASFKKPHEQGSSANGKAPLIVTGKSRKSRRNGSS